MEKKPQQSESRDSDKYIVRFPDGMRDALKAAAKANNRSMNAEIIDRITRSLEGAPIPLSVVTREVGDILERMRELKSQAECIVKEWAAEVAERAGKNSGEIDEESKKT